MFDLSFDRETCPKIEVESQTYSILSLSFLYVLSDLMVHVDPALLQLLPEALPLRQLSRYQHLGHGGGMEGAWRGMEGAWRRHGGSMEDVK